MNNDVNKSTSGTQTHDFFQKEIDTMRKEAKEDYQFDLVQFKYKTRAEVDSLRVQNEAFSLQMSILSKVLDRCTEYRQTCEAERDKLDEINKELRRELQIVQDELIAAKMTIGSLESTNTQWKEVVKEKLKENKKAENSPVYIAGHRNILSNFYPDSITIYGRHFKSREHAYNYQKAIFHNKEQLAEQIKKAVHAGKAKHLGSMRTDPGWTNRKVTIMQEIIDTMVKQSDQSRKALLNTGDSIIVEDVPDDFWGRGMDGQGRNMFGKLMMTLTGNLKNNVPATQSEFTPTEQLSEKDIMPVKTSTDIQPKDNVDVLLLGNSILRDVVPEKLSAKVKCNKIIANTITQASNFVEKCEKTYKCVVLQLLTNDV